MCFSLVCGACMERYAEWSEQMQQHVYGLSSITGQVMPILSLTYFILIGGIIAASLSSAIASLVGAPKVFQAICDDHLFPYVGFLGKGSPKDNEPRRGYLLTALIGTSLQLKIALSRVTHQMQTTNLNFRPCFHLSRRFERDSITDFKLLLNQLRLD